MDLKVLQRDNFEDEDSKWVLPKPDSQATLFKFSATDQYNRARIYKKKNIIHSIFSLFLTDKKNKNIQLQNATKRDVPFFK